MYDGPIDLQRRRHLDIALIHKALSSQVRRDILAWLKDPSGNFPGQTHGFENGVCAGQIDARTGLSQSAVSAHLRLLKHADLVGSQKIGQWVFFYRNETTIDAFLKEMNRSL